MKLAAFKEGLAALQGTFHPARAVPRLRIRSGALGWGLHKMSVAHGVVQAAVQSAIPAAQAAVLSFSDMTGYPSDLTSYLSDPTGYL